MNRVYLPETQAEIDARTLYWIVRHGPTKRQGAYICLKRGHVGVYELGPEYRKCRFTSYEEAKEMTKHKASASWARLRVIPVRKPQPWRSIEEVGAALALADEADVHFGPNRNLVDRYQEAKRIREGKNFRTGEVTSSPSDPRTKGFVARMKQSGLKTEG